MTDHVSTRQRIGVHRTGAGRPIIFLHSLLADAMEAIIGAIYLDSGLEQARGFIQEALRFALTGVEERETGRDHKTALNEWLRRRGEEASYEVIGSYGPDHAKSFEVEVSVSGIVIGRAIGHSKKEAEQQSARLALKQLIAAQGAPPPIPPELS
jgi:ribonuclease-3